MLLPICPALPALSLLSQALLFATPPTCNINSAPEPAGGRAQPRARVASMARVYADVNQNMPRSYWDYDSVNIGMFIPLPSPVRPSPDDTMRILNG